MIQGGGGGFRRDKNWKTNTEEGRDDGECDIDHT